MVISARFENIPESARKPRDPRRALLIGSEGGPVAGGFAPVLIHNLSATGLLIECDTALEAGEAIAIDLPRAGSTLARVVWSSGRFHGCQFARPVAETVLEAAEQLGAAEASAHAAGAGDETLPERIRRLRTRRRLSLDRLAELVGVSKPTVWAWERGRARPAPERLALLAAALGVETGELAPARDTPALRALLAESRARIAGTLGTSPEKIRIMIEL